MHGMFRANGGCGYVKKPDFLLSIGPNNEVFDPKAKLPVKKTLKVIKWLWIQHHLMCASTYVLIIGQVKVYMGDGWHLDFKQTHFDLYSPPDFYTRVSWLFFHRHHCFLKMRKTSSLMKGRKTSPTNDILPRFCPSHPPTQFIFTPLPIALISSIWHPYLPRPPLTVFI